MSGVRKTFFLYEVTIAACLISLTLTDIFTKREKSGILFQFYFFFYLKGGNLEAASTACISDFFDKNA